jgi:hypothetical protein
VAQNRDYTEGRLLDFSYDFGVTVIRHQNADAMILASARMRGIHPPDNIQNGRRPGGMPLKSAPARRRGSGYAFLTESTFCVSYSVPVALI